MFLNYFQNVMDWTFIYQILSFKEIIGTLDIEFRPKTEGLFKDAFGFIICQNP